MTAAALAAWEFLKGLPWKYIAIALAVLSLIVLVWRAPWAESRQKAKDAAAYGKQIAALTLDRDTHASNERVLQGAVDRQNVAIAAMKADGDQRIKDGAKALSEAQKANKGLKDQAANLTRSGGLKYAKDAPCVTSDALAAMGKI